MPKIKQIHDGHRSRMRERFMRDGLDNYRPHEVIEQLLFGVVRRANTNPLGHVLIDRFGSVDGVLNASYDELIEVDGIGPKIAEYIISVKQEMTEIICDFFRGRVFGSQYNIAFFASWFFNLRDSAPAIVISCTPNREFVDYYPLHDLNFADDLFDSFSVGCHIAVKNRIKHYYLIVKDESILSRENILQLREVTLHMRSYMLDAYYMVNQKPVSFLYRQIY